MYYHLTQNQRIELSLLLRLEYSQRRAATVLGVSPSTVCRELARNSSSARGYRANMTRVAARTRRAHANALRTKLLASAQLAALVTQRLSRNDSPEQIAGWLKATGRTASVCAQTIYDWLYRYVPHLCTHLHCRKGKYRRTREAGLRKAFRDKREEVRSIDARPTHVLRRKTYGHWEGDTIHGRGKSGYIATFVERKSGYLLAAVLPPPEYSAAGFASAAATCFAQVPARYRRTLTLDNGPEMKLPERIERTTGLRVYYAAPYHSWERGTNENTNGLLRFYFPKKTSFAGLTQEALDEAVRELNTRPRKRLGYKTPAQVFEKKW